MKRYFIEGFGTKTAFFGWACFSFFFLINLIKIYPHELWRDELQAWLIVTHTPSLRDLFTALKYEAHPPLYYLLLRGLHTLWQSPAVMGIVTAASGAGALVLILRLPIWSAWQRLFWIFNYYIFFEYSVLSRSYSLSLLLFALLLFNEVSGTPKGKLWRSSLILSLNALVSVYGALLSIVFGFYLFLRQPKAWLRGPSWLLVSFLILSVWLIRPAPDMNFGPGRFISFHWETVSRVTQALFLSLFSIPEWTLHFWNTHALNARGPHVALLLSLILSIAFVRYFKRDRPALLSWLFSFALFFSFTYVVYFGSARHHGHFFLASLGLMALSGRGPEKLAHSRLVTLLLFLGAVGGISAEIQSFRAPFSQARMAAQWLDLQKQSCPGSVVADDDISTSPISFHLSEPLFYLRTGAEGTFIRWNNERRYSSETALSEQLRSELIRRDCIRLVLGEDSPMRSNLAKHLSGYEIISQAEFRPAVQRDEAFSTYVIRPK